jgi:hypothetical protein
MKKPMLQHAREPGDRVGALISATCCQFSPTTSLKIVVFHTPAVMKTKLEIAIRPHQQGLEQLPRPEDVGEQRALALALLARDGVER